MYFDTLDQRVMRCIVFPGHPDEKNSRMICKIYAGFESCASLLHDQEWTQRTLDNLSNLHVCRGNIDSENVRLQPESAMSGPHHYFGYLEPEKAYLFHFTDEDGFPTFTPTFTIPDQVHNKLPLPNSFPLRLKKEDYSWQSHTQPSNPFSLFQSPGIFWSKFTKLHIPTLYAASCFDLSIFNISLINSENEPIYFNSTFIKPEANDRLRLITYHFGSRYYENFCLKQNGIFLERHDFVQGVTPMNRECGGTIIVGRIIPETEELQLIQVYIPFGFVLILHPNAIHGDSTLTGLYLMMMSGNHNVMQLSDTVFLRHTQGLIAVEDINSNLEEEKEYKDKNYNHLLMTNSKCSLDELRNVWSHVETQLYENVRRKQPYWNYLVWRSVMLSIKFWAKTFNYL
jgi:hypothetical protein